MALSQRELRQTAHEGAADAEDMDMHEESNEASGVES
jgi:hypothetical protein